MATVTMGFAADTSAMRQSLQDLTLLLVAREVGQPLCEIVVCDLAGILDKGLPLPPEIGNLMVGEPMFLGTCRAGGDVTVQFTAGDQYLILFAAIAADAKRQFTFKHGWPLLFPDEGSHDAADESSGSDAGVPPSAASRGAQHG